MSKPRRLHPVTPSPGLPLYQAVKDAVRSAIDEGVFDPGEQLPSTKSLSEQLSVSLVTVHRALQELVAGGVLRRSQGLGTFVHERYFERSDTLAGMRFGLVFHAECSLADQYYGPILDGFRYSAAELGVDLVLLRFGEDWRSECQGYLYVNPFQADLDKPPRFGRRRTDMGRNPPVMVVGASFERAGIGSVDSDNAGMARQAIAHLASLGHTCVGFVGSNSGASNSIDRWNGYQQACRDLKIEARELLLLRAPKWRLDAGDIDSVAELLQRPDRPTAVFAAGYYLALNVYSAAGRAGLHLPTQLSVVGIDDPPSASHLSPSLTTVRQPLEQMGRRAIRELFELVGQDAPVVPRTLLQGELIVRASTAPPNAPRPGLRVASRRQAAGLSRPEET